MQIRKCGISILGQNVKRWTLTIVYRQSNRFSRVYCIHLSLVGNNYICIVHNDKRLKPAWCSWVWLSKYSLTELHKWRHSIDVITHIMEKLGYICMFENTFKTSKTSPFGNLGCFRMKIFLLIKIPLYSI